MTCRVGIGGVWRLVGIGIGRKRKERGKVNGVINREEAERRRGN